MEGAALSNFDNGLMDEWINEAGFLMLILISNFHFRAKLFI